MLLSVVLVCFVVFVSGCINSSLIPEECSEFEGDTCKLFDCMVDDCSCDYSDTENPILFEGEDLVNSEDDAFDTVFMYLTTEGLLGNHAPIQEIKANSYFYNSLVRDETTNKTYRLMVSHDGKVLKTKCDTVTMYDPSTGKSYKITKKDTEKCNDIEDPCEKYVCMHEKCICEKGIVLEPSEGFSMKETNIYALADAVMVHLTEQEILDENISYDYTMRDINLIDENYYNITFKSADKSYIVAYQVMYYDGTLLDIECNE